MGPHSEKGELPKIKGICTGHVKSGNYGGSAQYEVFPSVYHYSYYDKGGDENEAQRREFDTITTAFLDRSKVNEYTVLRDYLYYIYIQDMEQIGETHARFGRRIAVGNSNQPIPILFFLEDEKNTVLALSPYNAEIGWDDDFGKLTDFLREHAYHFRSEMPDAFFSTHYASQIVR